MVSSQEGSKTQKRGRNRLPAPFWLIMSVIRPGDEKGISRLRPRREPNALTLYRNEAACQADLIVKNGQCYHHRIDDPQPGEQDCEPDEAA